MAIDPAAVDPVRQVLADTGKRGVDVAIDCAAKGDTINQCLHVTRNAGRIVLTGIPSETHLPVAFHVMRRKEIAMFNVRRSNHESAAALEILASHPERFAPLLTHERPLTEVQRAFEMIEAYEDGVGKVVLRP